jgi:hypothetical protein
MEISKSKMPGSTHVQLSGSHGFITKAKGIQKESSKPEQRCDGLEQRLCLQFLAAQPQLCRGRGAYSGASAVAIKRRLRMECEEEYNQAKRDLQNPQ